MTISTETLLVVSLMMAVFAAVATVGSSVFLGAGYERLRASMQAIRRQTAYFAEAIRKLDHRVSAVEKQSGYFFETLHQMQGGNHKPDTSKMSVAECIDNAEQEHHLIMDDEPEVKPVRKSPAVESAADTEIRVN